MCMENHKKLTKRDKKSNISKVRKIANMQVVVRTLIWKINKIPTWLNVEHTESFKNQTKYMMFEIRYLL